MTASLVELLQGVHPGIAQLFAKIELPDRIFEQSKLDKNPYAPHFDYLPTCLDKPVWAVLCSDGEVRHYSMRIGRWTVVLCCEVADRLYLGIRVVRKYNPTIATAWPVLRRFASTKVETQIRKLTAWIEQDSPDDITDFVQWIGSGNEEFGFLQAIKQATNTNVRVEAMAVFADYLEENDDSRAEDVRRVMEYADHVQVERGK